MSGLLLGLGGLLAVVGIVGLVVWYILHKDKNTLTFRSLLVAYFYLVAALSLLAVVYGGTTLTKALLSDVFGRSFSYYDYSQYAEPGVAIDMAANPDAPDSKVSEDQKLKAAEFQAAQVESQYQNDIYNGVSALIVGLLFLLVHCIGWSKMEPAEERRESVLFKGYVLLQLVLYSIVTLIALPVGISQSLRFWLDQAALDSSGMARPGEALALAIWVTPLWLVWIWLTMRALHKAK